jgi:hypothetical protein
MSGRDYAEDIGRIDWKYTGESITTEHVVAGKTSAILKVLDRVSSAIQNLLALVRRELDASYEARAIARARVLGMIENHHRAPKGLGEWSMADLFVRMHGPHADPWDRNLWHQIADAERTLEGWGPRKSGWLRVWAHQMPNRHVAEKEWAESAEALMESDDDAEDEEDD